MGGDKLEEDVGNLACTQVGGNGVEMEGGHDQSTDPHMEGGRVGAADSVLVGMAVVWVAPSVNKSKQDFVRLRYFPAG